MTRLRSVVSVGCGAALMFVWHGVAQTFPWGPSVVRNFSATAGDPYVASTTRLEQGAPGTWTTPAFDEQFGGWISTLATDRTFSWVISAPREWYDLPRYFALHALTQLGAALLLFLALRILAPLSRVRRLSAVCVFGVATSLSIYGGMMNWIGLPAAYAMGQAFNYTAGWFLGAVVIDWVRGTRRS